MNKLFRGKVKFLSYLMAAVALVGSIAYATPGRESLVALDQVALGRVSAQRALEHIRYLSEKIGPRVAGTEQEVQGAEYIKQQLNNLGYDVEMQEFDIKNVVASLQIKSLPKGLQPNAAKGSGYTEKGGVTAQLVWAGLGGKLEDFSEKVRGSIALVERGGEIPFAVKVKNAVQAGAAGVIIINNEEGSLRPDLGDYLSPIPVLGVTRDEGVKLRDPPEVVATIQAELKTKSQNVIAKRVPEKADGREGIIYITAHYDSVPNAPGANDNASGTAALLEMARVLKAVPTDKEVRFIACGAEEIGLKGSEYYMSKLTDEEISRSIANFNMDMIATSYEQCNILYADTVDGEPNLVSEAACTSGARQGKDLLKVNYGRSSDHASFGDYGIPAACFIWGDQNGKLEPWYHKPEDNLNINFSLQKLQTASDIIVAALDSVLRTEIPLDRNPLEKGGQKV